MDDLRFYMLFNNNLSVISVQWKGDNERQCAKEPHLRLENFLLQHLRSASQQPNIELPEGLYLIEEK